MADQIPDSAKSNMSWIDIAVLGQKRGVVIVDQAPGWADFIDGLHFADVFEGDEPEHLEPGVYRWSGFTIGSWDEGDPCVAKGGTFTRAAPPAMDREAVEAEVERIMAMSDDEILAEVDAEDVAWARAFKQGLRTGQHVSTADAPVKALRSIVAKHTRVGGYPDTHAIARDAYNLALSTLSADAIRQGEGDMERAAKIAERYEPMGYMSEREREYCREHGQEIADRIRIAATPASHASDGGKA